MRSAIGYINNMQQLITDCDAGLVDRALFAAAEPALSPAPATVSPLQSGPGKKSGRKSGSSKAGSGEKRARGGAGRAGARDNTAASKVKACKRVILDQKWTNYTAQFLEDKFSKEVSKAVQLDSSYCTQLEDTLELAGLVGGADTCHVVPECHAPLSAATPSASTKLPAIDIFSAAYKDFGDCGVGVVGLGDAASVNNISIHISLIEDRVVECQDAAEQLVIIRDYL